MRLEKGGKTVVVKLAEPNPRRPKFRGFDLKVQINGVVAQNVPLNCIVSFYKDFDII